MREVGIDAWKDKGVDTKQLEIVFGQNKDASNGVVVLRTNPNYPWDRIVSLCQVDGLIKTPVNGQMRVALAPHLARGLYFEFKLRKDVN